MYLCSCFLLFLFYVCLLSSSSSTSPFIYLKPFLPVLGVRALRNQTHWRKEEEEWKRNMYAKHEHKHSATHARLHALLHIYSERRTCTHFMLCITNTSQFKYSTVFYIAGWIIARVSEREWEQKRYCELVSVCTVFGAVGAAAIAFTYATTGCCCRLCCCCSRWLVSFLRIALYLSLSIAVTHHQHQPVPYRECVIVQQNDIGPFWNTPCAVYIYTKFVHTIGI